VNYKHGHARKGRKSPEFYVWQAMLARCYRKTHISYPDYGGRGIRVCARWIRDFAAFLHDIGPRPSVRHTLDRENTAGNYTPKNTRWVTRDVQNRNRRNNVLVTINGRRRPLSAWAETFNIPYGTVRNRLGRGWSARRALTTPVRTTRPPVSAMVRAKVRKLYATGKWTQRALADRFGLHGGRDNIRSILSEVAT
jgi:hypothetical protein